MPGRSCVGRWLLWGHGKDRAHDALDLGAHGVKADVSSESPLNLGLKLLLVDVAVLVARPVLDLTGHLVDGPITHQAFVLGVTPVLWIMGDVPTIRAAGEDWCNLQTAFLIFFIRRAVFGILNRGNGTVVVSQGLLVFCNRDSG